MKNAALLITACLFACVTYSQKIKESEVPAAVKQSFTKGFPAAKEVKWSRESETEFEAEFEIAKVEKTASFDADGAWLETETEIKHTDLPKEVQATIAKDFAGYKIEEPEKLESPDNPLLYEVELKKGKVTFEVQFTADGTVMKKTEEKEGNQKH